MVANVGTIDRAIRLVLGLALLGLVFWGPKTPWGWLGLVLVGTSAIRFCPLYRLIGLRTTAAADTTAGR